MRKVALDLGTRKTAYCEVRDGKVVQRRTEDAVRDFEPLLGPEQPEAAVAIEACREAWHVHDLLTIWGNQVVLVDTTRSHRLGIGQHGRKTDRIDAEVLALALERGGSLNSARELAAGTACSACDASPLRVFRSGSRTRVCGQRRTAPLRACGWGVWRALGREACGASHPFGCSEAARAPEFVGREGRVRRGVGPSPWRMPGVEGPGARSRGAASTHGRHLDAQHKEQQNTTRIVICRVGH